MTERNHTPIHLGQCLFGYEDGHKLLATSRRLDAEDQAFLLQQSDLIPALDRSVSNSYVTGIPLPSTKVYAFMRTWLAPEMSRPGCVWTHALLIDFSDLARIRDLNSLSQRFVRPRRNILDAFTMPVVIDESQEFEPLIRREMKLQTRQCVNALQAAYSSERIGEVVGDTDEYEEVLLALWSQQWPGLRRTFSFSTAAVRLSTTTYRSRFSIRIVSRRGSEESPPHVGSPDAIEPWLFLAIDDLRTGAGGELRRFLWRYGADLSRPREGFNLLTRLYASTRGPSHFPTGSLAPLLSTVAIELPKPTDGKLLKEDLIKGNRSTYSLLPASDATEVLAYFASRGRDSALPQPPELLYEELPCLWKSRSHEILSIIEMATVNAPEISSAVVHQTSPLIEQAEFIHLTEGYSEARKAFVRARPTLLDSEGAENIPESELLDLMMAIGDDDQLAHRVLVRMLRCSYKSIADGFAKLYPKQTAICVVNQVARELTSQYPTLPNVWIQSARSLDLRSLLTLTLDTAQKTSELAASVLLIGSASWEPAQQSSVRWSDVLMRLRDDVTGYPRQLLQAFLLSLALTDKLIGCESLFEYSFQAIHDDISNARLPQDLFDRLAPNLPDLHWWSQWDTCLRLRIAVVDAYVTGSLDPASLLHLSSNQYIVDEIWRTLQETSSGRSYLQRIQ